MSSSTAPTEFERLRSDRNRLIQSGYDKGTIRSDLVVSKDVRRHRLMSIDYIRTLRCHGRDRSLKNLHRSTKPLWGAKGTFSCPDCILLPALRRVPFPSLSFFTFWSAWVPRATRTDFPREKIPATTQPLSRVLGWRDCLRVDVQRRS